MWMEPPAWSWEDSGLERCPTSFLPVEITMLLLGLADALNHIDFEAGIRVAFLGGPLVSLDAFSLMCAVGSHLLAFLLRFQKYFSQSFIGLLILRFKG